MKTLENVDKMIEFDAWFEVYDKCEPPFEKISMKALEAHKAVFKSHKTAPVQQDMK